MKVTQGVWVVKISNDYEWATVYGKYETAEEAYNKTRLFECEYDGYKVRYLHEGEDLPNVSTIYGL